LRKLAYSFLIDGNKACENSFLRKSMDKKEIDDVKANRNLIKKGV